MLHRPNGEAEKGDFREAHSVMTSYNSLMSKNLAYLLGTMLCGTIGCGTANQRVDSHQALYGTWECLSAVVNGKALPEKTVDVLRLTIDRQRYKTEKGSEVLFDSTYIVDTSKEPNEINMLGTEGDLAGKEAQGIFVISGNHLQVCYTMPGNPRPTRFESLPGSKAYWIVWKKVSGAP